MTVSNAETALDLTRDRYGHTVHPEAAAAARTRRDRTAVEAYVTHLAPHIDPLFDTVRLSLVRRSARPAPQHRGAES